MDGRHLEVLDPTGTANLAKIKDFHAADYARTEMVIGAGTFTVPLSYRDLFFTGDDVRVDMRILPYRTLPGSTPYLDMETEWLVQDAEEVQDDNGKSSLNLYCVDGVFLMDTRIVAYNAGTAYTEKTDNAGDLCKAIMRENLGALATDTDRDLSAYLAVQADLADGASIAKAFARRKVLAVCKEVADASAKAGSYLSFDVVSTTPGSLEFRTYATYRGNDHRASSGQPLLVGRDYRNLTKFRLRYSHTGEVNYCYAGGLGEGVARAIGTASDTARIGASPFRRIEAFKEGLNTSDTTTLDDEADSLIRLQRPRITVTGTINQTDSFLYGKHFRFGDYLTISDRNQSFDARLSSVHVTVRGGRETIEGKLRGEQ